MIDINNIPDTFIKRNLTEYQKELLCLKYEVYNLFNEQLEANPLISKAEIYRNISRTKPLQPDTIRLMIYEIEKNSML